MNAPANILALVTALGAALIGGTFFAFSNFIMPALARQPAASGIGTMQAVNITVINPVFLGVFMGTALLAIALVVAVLVGGHPRQFLVIAGAALYVAGTFA
ncbi:MAG: hypothetical protein JWQ65_653, partial [Devosia sp.]|nr:hypothetical protein [Devosia sp.]